MMSGPPCGSRDRGRTRFMQHLESWAAGFTKTDQPFRGKIQPVASYSYRLGNWVLCNVLPEDCERPIKINIRLRKVPGDGYEMRMRCGTSWESDKAWFKKLGESQKRRSLFGATEMPQSSREVAGMSPAEYQDWVLICQPFPFMRLPVELRLIVAGFALGKLSPCNDPKEPQFGISLKGVLVTGPSRNFSECDRVTFQSLVLLNKEFHSQMIAWFYSTSMFSFLGFTSLAAFLELIPRNIASLIGKVRVEDFEWLALAFLTPCSAVGEFSSPGKTMDFCAYTCMVDWWPKPSIVPYLINWKPCKSPDHYHHHLVHHGHPFGVCTRTYSRVADAPRDFLQLKELEMRLCYIRLGPDHRYADPHGHVFNKVSINDDVDFLPPLYLEWWAKAAHEMFGAERLHVALQDGHYEYKLSRETIRSLEQKTWEQLRVKADVPRHKLSHLKYDV